MRESTLTGPRPASPAATRPAEASAPAPRLAPGALWGRASTDIALDTPRDLTPLVTTLRWITFGVGVLLAGLQGSETSRIALPAVALLAALTLWRTARPIAPAGSAQRFALDLALDLPIALLAVAATGAFASPFALTVVPVLFLAAYRGGYLRGLLTLVPTFAILATAQIGAEAQDDRALLVAHAAVLYVVTTALGGFTRSVLASAEESARAVELERSRVDLEMDRMRAANELLLALYDVTQQLSASLDLGEVIQSTQRRVRELFDYTSAVIVVRDEGSDSWRVQLTEGARLPASLPDEHLPWDLREARLVDSTTTEGDLVAGKRAGCSPSARSALFAPLRTGDRLVGMLTLEHTRPDHFTPRDQRILDELTKPLALALDNARWFGKLRSIGAEAERARIARDLHDRFAQSLAYIGFELERLGDHDGEARTSLLELRDMVRELVTELRDMLHELRAGVDDVTSLGEAIRDHSKRFADRTGLHVHLDVPDEQPRLAVHVEQELWRILHEALTNVERHAHAENVWIRWIVRGHGAILAVRDDGRGFEPRAVPRDRFGLVGIRERTEAISAELELISRVGLGAELTIRVSVRP